MSMSATRTPITITICGDSIFDNGVYVDPPGRDFHSHLTDHIDGATIDFRAVDGSVCRDVSEDQLGDVSAGTALVISAGGNDALGHLYLLEDPEVEPERFLSTAIRLGVIQSGFRADYRAMLQRASSRAARLLVCTIYRPRYHLEGRPREIIQMIDPLLSIFNDVIQEEARAVSADILDLRAICTEDEHFANAIEPSDNGGRAIAAKVAQWCIADETQFL